MTKVLLHYDLLRPLDDELLKRISDAHGTYGFQRIWVDPSYTGISVEFDASRLSRDKVEARLHGVGIPVQPR